MKDDMFSMSAKYLFLISYFTTTLDSYALPWPTE